jgi:hypothetical protein
MEKTIEISLNEIEIELRQLIQKLLEPEEEIFVCFRVEYHMVWAEVITNRQVIIAKAIALRSGVFMFKPKIDMPHVSSILLSEITDVTLGRSEDYDLFTVHITGEENTKLEASFTLETAAQKFHKTLTGLILKEKKQFPTGSTAERLRELSELLESSLITEEEFQKKRTEILNNL